MSDIGVKAPETHSSLLDPQWLVGRGRLAQSIKLEEKGPERIIVLAVGAIVSALVLFLLWAALASVTEVASASGEVTPLGSLKRIQHLEGGIVRAVHVQDGDLVDKDQVLIELESGAAAPQLEQSRTRLAALKLQLSQLDAMGSGNKASFDVNDQRFAGLAAAQSSILEMKRQELASKGSVLAEQLAEARAELASQSAQENAARQTVAILSEQAGMYRRLTQQGYASRMRLLDQQRQLMQARMQLADIQGAIEKARKAVAGGEARIAELHAATRLDATEQMGKVKSDIAELEAVIAASEDRVTRLAVRSPVRGIVNGLQAETIGGVVQPGATIMQIIPVDAPLIVEARVSPRDIGFVRIGQEVVVKVTTFDYTRFGGIAGKVESLSATTFQDEHGNFFYRARIRLAKSYVGNDPQRNFVIPGMTVLADILTDRKTVLAYLLKPVVRAVDDSLHER